jgi:hypothetical protein
MNGILLEIKKNKMGDVLSGAKEQNRRGKMGLLGF